jgi:hypothetical protein
MLLIVRKSSPDAEKKKVHRLKEFGLDERKLQQVLFRSLDRLFPDDELILLMQSEPGREEPDLMAIDKYGYLYIFELKAWESVVENLLQVLRYGQIYGASKYAELNALFRKRGDSPLSLVEAYKQKFCQDLSEDRFNQKQVFVVMTSGLDYKTREAIHYWRSCGLDIRPWIYRVYEGSSEDESLLEISAFRVGDNPYEDLSEGYFILNTNYGRRHSDHDDMLSNAKAAAYFKPWKYKIERLKRGDVVFLYQSGVGVVAVGEADGKLVKAAYLGNPECADEEYFMKLRNFERVDRPVTAAEIKELSGVNYVFMGTMFGLAEESGKKLRQLITQRKQKRNGATMK